MTLARQEVERVYREESRRVLATLIRLLGDFDRSRSQFKIVRPRECQQPFVRLTLPEI